MTLYFVSLPAATPQPAAQLRHHARLKDFFVQNALECGERQKDISREASV